MIFLESMTVVYIFNLFYFYCNIPSTGNFLQQDISKSYIFFLNKNYCSLSFTVDFVVPKKDESIMEAYEKWRGWGDAKACCDYGLHVGVTNWTNDTPKEMDELVKEKG